MDSRQRLEVLNTWLTTAEEAKHWHFNELRSEVAEALAEEEKSSELGKSAKLLATKVGVIEIQARGRALGLLRLDDQIKEATRLLMGISAVAIVLNVNREAIRWAEAEIKAFEKMKTELSQLGEGRDFKKFTEALTLLRVDIEMHSGAVNKGVVNKCDAILRGRSEDLKRLGITIPALEEEKASDGKTLAQRWLERLTPVAVAYDEATKGRRVGKGDAVDKLRGDLPELPAAASSSSHLSSSFFGSHSTAQTSRSSVRSEYFDVILLLSIIIGGAVGGWAIAKHWKLEIPTDISCFLGGMAAFSLLSLISCLKDYCAPARQESGVINQGASMRRA